MFPFKPVNLGGWIVFSYFKLSKAFFHGSFVTAAVLDVFPKCCVLQIEYDILLQRWLISLDGQHIIAMALPEFLGNLGLGSYGVNRDNLIFDVDLIQ